MKIEKDTVIAIPLENGSYKLAHIVYASTYFKDVILMAFFPGLFEEPVLPKQGPDSYEAQTMYTGVDSIKKGKWLVLGKLDVPQYAPISKRIVAGEVWVEDKCIGSVSDKDRASLPKMLTIGYKIIVKRLLNNESNN